jgi:hypothetical protein
MARLQAIYYRAPDGSEPVNDFIDALPVKSHAEKQVARDRWNDFRARMDAERRKPPRAAGRDAP